jgi:hypothetical protein
MPETGNSPVSVDTPKTILVPLEFHRPGREAALLALGGMAPGDDEAVVVSDAREGMVAVMAVASSVARQLERGGVEVTSPLLDVACEGGGDRVVNIALAGTNAYLAVREGGRTAMAEALPDNSPDSILYYMQVVGRRFKLRRFHIRVWGEGAAEVVSLLGQYFKRVNLAN